MNKGLENEKETSLLDEFLHLTYEDALAYAGFMMFVATMLFWLIILGA